MGGGESKFSSLFVSTHPPLRMDFFFFLLQNKRGCSLEKMLTRRMSTDSIPTSRKYMYVCIHIYHQSSYAYVC